MGNTDEKLGILLISYEKHKTTAEKEWKSLKKNVSQQGSVKMLWHISWTEVDKIQLFWTSSLDHFSKT